MLQSDTRQERKNRVGGEKRAGKREDWKKEKRGKEAEEGGREGEKVEREE